MVFPGRCSCGGLSYASQGTQAHNDAYPHDTPSSVVVGPLWRMFSRQGMILVDTRAGLLRLRPVVTKGIARCSHQTDTNASLLSEWLVRFQPMPRCSDRLDVALHVKADRIRLLTHVTIVYAHRKANNER